MRGLKYLIPRSSLQNNLVASFAYDAWIEIDHARPNVIIAMVASFAYDAWIEIRRCYDGNES